MFHADGQTNGYTDLTKLIIAFHEFANAPNNTQEYTKKAKRSYINAAKTPAQICKGKAFPLQAWTGPWGFSSLRLQNF